MYHMLVANLAGTMLALIKVIWVPFRSFLQMWPQGPGEVSDDREGDNDAVSGDHCNEA